jgi:DNA-binding winged helix-turn-helix (wHTH) protein
MADKNQFFYPVTESTIHDYAASIFGPIKRGECVTTVWVPMAGRRMWNKFIIDNIALFEKELPDYKKHIFVYVDPLDLTEQSLAGYLRLMIRSFIDVCSGCGCCKELIEPLIESNIFSDEQVSYSKLLEGFRELLMKVINSGFEPIFFLGEFDELAFANTTFFDNLKSLWNKVNHKIYYVFLMLGSVTKQENIKRWDELNEAILQNIIYIPIRTDEDFNYIVEVFSHEYSLKLSPGELEIIKNLCGGHPYMIKVAIRQISRCDENTRKNTSQLENMLLNYYELISVAKGIFDYRSEKEKQLLKLIVQKRDIDREEFQDDIELLENLGLIIKISDCSYRPFGKLYECAVTSSFKEKKPVQTVSDGNLKLEEETGSILLEGRTIEEHFTRQEYSVLVALLQKANKLQSRDDVGAAIWGKDSYEKYSDWAIDQLISKLRKKLESLKIKDRLVTLRGKGYKLIQPAP